jgi:hypothetical protein
MSVDYTRKHQWTITPKGRGTRRPTLIYTTTCREVAIRERDPFLKEDMGDIPTGGAIIFSMIG